MPAPTISDITNPRPSAEVTNKSEQILFVSEWEAFTLGVSENFVPEANALGEYLDDLSVSIDASANAAIVAANFKGNWNSGTSYSINDSVLFTNGITYKAILANTNQTPPNATYWLDTGFGGQINTAGTKTAPVGADKIGIYDSVSGLLKSLSFTNIWANLTTLFSSLDIINTSNPSVELISSKRRSDWTFGISGTGAIQIELVGLYPYSLDGIMTVRIKDTMQNAFKIDIDGRWDASNTWSAYHAIGDKQINVRFAKDASKAYILIGDTSTVWGNTRLEIDDILSNYNSSLTLGFNVSVVSSYPTTVVATVLPNTIENLILTGTPTAPTQTAGDNSTKLATTAYVDDKIKLLTSAATTSGTSIDIAIPSWAKRITVVLNNVSTSGTSSALIRLADTAAQTNGYTWLGSYAGGTNQAGNASITSAFAVDNASAPGASANRNGIMEIVREGGNRYVGNYVGSAGVFSHQGGGNITLSQVATYVRLTTANGTDTFDGGYVNIMIEG